MSTDKPYEAVNPHADHPGYDSRNCPLSLQVTGRGPWGQIARAGFSCLMTGGHCLPDEHCDDRRAREAEYREREALFAEARTKPIHLEVE